MKVYSRGNAKLFLVFVIVLTGLGGLLYYSWQKRLIKTTPTQKTSPTPTSDAIANWKTYTNTSAGYALKYPSRLEPTTKAPGLGLDLAQPTSQSINLKSIEVKFFDYTPSDVEYSEWQKEKVYINNIDATHYQKFDSANSLNKEFYLFYNPDTSKYIQYYIENPTPENKKVFDQIISTFKFVE